MQGAGTAETRNSNPPAADENREERPDGFGSLAHDGPSVVARADVSENETWRSLGLRGMGWESRGDFGERSGYPPPGVFCMC